MGLIPSSQNLPIGGSKILTFPLLAQREEGYWFSRERFSSVASGFFDRHLPYHLFSCIVQYRYVVGTKLPCACKCEVRDPKEDIIQSKANKIKPPPTRKRIREVDGRIMSLTLVSTPPTSSPSSTSSTSASSQSIESITTFDTLRCRRSEEQQQQQQIQRNSHRRRRQAHRQFQVLIVVVVVMMTIGLLGGSGNVLGRRLQQGQHSIFHLGVVVRALSTTTTTSFVLSSSRIRQRISSPPPPSLAPVFFRRIDSRNTNNNNLSRPTRTIITTTSPSSNTMTTLAAAAADPSSTSTTNSTTSTTGSSGDTIDGERQLMSGSCRVSVFDHLSMLVRIFFMSSLTQTSLPHPFLV